MRVLIIGGSGRTGKLTTEELLHRGHKVTALVRNMSAMEDMPAGLDTIKGTPSNIADVRAAFEYDLPAAVIMTLNAPRESDSPFAAPMAPPRLMANCNANIVAAMKEFGVPKLVVLQAFGVGDSWPNMNCVLRLLMSKSNMSHQYLDHNQTEQEVRNSGVTYVLVRPSRLVDTDTEKVKVWPNHGKGVPLMAQISRRSVARWLVDATETDQWDNTEPVITN